jgi:hypothetical protein
MVVAIFLAGGAVSAQGNTSHPGYYPIEEMGILAKDDLEVDINLEGAMLQVAAGAMQEEAEGEGQMLSQLVSGLDRVRVQVGSPGAADASTIAYSFENAISTMESEGWNRILRVTEEDSQVHLFARENGGRIAGLTLLVNDDDDEIVLVNILGDIDPEVLGKMLAAADQMPNLEELMINVE